MILALGAVAVVLLVYWLVSPSNKMKKYGNMIPGPKPMPVVGNALNFHLVGPKAYEELRNARQKYGPIFRIWLGPELNVFFSHPDDVQFILSSTTNITKAKVYDVLHSWLGTGLLVSTGELWQGRRKAITPTFHFKVLDDFVPTFNKCSNTLVELLDSKAGKGPFDLSEYLSNCALDVISESAMGIQVEAQTKPKSDYVTSILELTKLLGLKINYPWFKIEPIYTLSGQKNKEESRLKILHGLTSKVLYEKKAQLQNSNNKKEEENDFGMKKRKAFLELMLNIRNENRRFFDSDQAVLDEVTTFMFEGHDTTTACLTFTTWLLGRYPEVQEKVYKEVAAILEDNPVLKIEHFQEMKYLERVIKESLRMYPPVPIVGRRIEKDTTFPCGFTVPAGAEVYVNILLVQRDPDFFPNPDEFNPDRFLDDIKHPYSYVPFSAGPRNCIGQKFAMLDLKSILAHLVYSYKISSVSNAEKIDHQVILRVLGTIDVTLTKRKHEGQA